MERKASVVWQGGLKGGKGSITTNSGALANAPYSFGTRFESEGGTNPEELIAAAHAACFSMALASELEKLGLKPEKISTSGTATLDRVNGDWTVTALQLDTLAFVPGADLSSFMDAASKAKAGCPISRLLRAPITLNASVKSEKHDAA
jgi:osmotically inducible protein OsmC